MDAPVLRLLDANLNRASEGLRTLEDHYRFLLDDAWASSDVKRIRHGVYALRLRIDAGVRKADTAAGSRNDGTISPTIAGRDTPGDVGRDVKTPAEASRADARSVAQAALARATQALRAVEEYAKLFDAKAAREAEAWRYRLYAHGSRLERTAGKADRLRRFARVRSWKKLIDPPAEWASSMLASFDVGERIPVEDGDVDGWVAWPPVAKLGEGTVLSAMRAVRRTLDEGMERRRGDGRPLPSPPLLVWAGSPALAERADWDAVLLGADAMPAADARRLIGMDRLLLSSDSIAREDPLAVDGVLAALAE